LETWGPFDASSLSCKASTVRLRPYQQECLSVLGQRYLAGGRRLLVSLPTGTGKTVIFSQFPRHFRMKRRLLVLAHRRELLDQALAKFRDVDDTLSVGIEQADRSALDAQVVLASVQTLQGKRLTALAPEQFNLVVVDEAHHAVAPSYRRIFEHLGVFAPGTAKLLVGFTATPRRGDKQGLGQVFEEIAYSRGLEEMIRDGFLCPIRGWRVRSGVSLDAVKVRAGDFVESALAEAVDNAPRNDLLTGAYEKLAKGRRCIVFCVNVQHAQNVACAFRKAGFRSQAVWGAMGLQDRATVLRELARGELDVVTNCNVLTEGFDEPSVDCVLMARPTRSLGLYVQMVGRGTRLHAGKGDLLVIDIADNTRKHALAGLGALFDLPEGMQLGGHDALAVAGQIRQMGTRFPWVDTSLVRRAEDLALAAERVEFFRLDPPEEIEKYTRFTWLRAPAGGYRLVLPRPSNHPIAPPQTLVVRPTLLGDFEIQMVEGAEERTVGRSATLPGAIEKADQLVHRQRKDALKVVSQSAPWRRQEPTDKQLAFLRSKGVPVPANLTRGQASLLVSYLVS